MTDPIISREQVEAANRLHYQISSWLRDHANADEGQVFDLYPDQQPLVLIALAALASGPAQDAQVEPQLPGCSRCGQFSNGLPLCRACLAVDALAKIERITWQEGDHPAKQLIACRKVASSILAGETLGPSTLAANCIPSVSESRRGEPAPSMLVADRAAGVIVNKGYAKPAPASAERRQGHSRLVYDKEKRTIVTVDPHPPASPLGQEWRRAQPEQIAKFVAVFEALSAYEAEQEFIRGHGLFSKEDCPMPEVVTVLAWLRSLTSAQGHRGSK